MVNVYELEFAPPGLTTVMLALPAEAIKLAGTVAVNWLALTKLVESGVPFHSTVDPDTKFAPLTVRVKEGPPAGALMGLMVLISGPVEEEPSVNTGARKLTVDPGVKTPGAQVSFKYQ
jgi:hypothetical protein